MQYNSTKGLSLIFFVFNLIFFCSGAGEQVGEWVKASDWYSEARVSGVGHQTSPGSAEVEQQQRN